MEAFGSLLVLFFFLGLGSLLAFKGWLPSTFMCRLDLLLALALRVLLFLMGLRIGQVEIGAAEFQAVGVLSISYAVLTILGTFLILLPFLPSMRRAARWGSGVPAMQNGLPLEGRGSRALFRFVEPLGLFLFVAIGFLAALFIPLFHRIPNSAGSWTLNILLFLIGAHLVRSGIDIRGMVKNPLMILLPLGTAAGSVAAGILAAPLFGLSPAEGGALSAGFGWYTLSGVIISDMGDPLLGSAGFLINLFRETIALFIIPYLGSLGLPWMAIGAGGATSMDVTLPLIEQSCGDRQVPLAISHGALLSFLVPFLVPFFYSMV